MTLNDFGTLCHDRGQLTKALRLFSEAMEINERLGYATSVTVNRNNIGMVLRQLGRFEAARGHLMQALSANRKSGSPDVLASLDELSQLHAHLGEHSQALNAAREALVLARSSHDPRAEAAVLGTLGDALLAVGRVDEARECFRDAEGIATKCSYAFYAIRARIGLARADLAAGLVESAETIAAQATAAAKAQGYTSLESEGLLAMARIQLALHNPDRTMQLCHEILRLPGGEETYQAAITRRLLETALEPAGTPPN